MRRPPRRRRCRCCRCCCCSLQLQLQYLLPLQVGRLVSNCWARLVNLLRFDLFLLHFFRALPGHVTRKWPIRPPMLCLQLHFVFRRFGSCDMANKSKSEIYFYVNGSGSGSGSANAFRERKSSNSIQQQKQKNKRFSFTVPRVGGGRCGRGRHMFPVCRIADRWLRPGNGLGRIRTTAAMKQLRFCSQRIADCRLQIADRWTGLQTFDSFLLHSSPPSPPSRKRKNLRPGRSDSLGIIKPLHHSWRGSRVNENQSVWRE